MKFLVTCATQLAGFALLKKLIISRVYDIVGFWLIYRNKLS